MAISDETLALAIPPELKTDHPDAALVVQAILIALAANENSGAMTAKGRMRDTFTALQTVYVPVFQAHIAKEDEDWNALKSRADAPYVHVKLVSSHRNELPGGIVKTSYDGITEANGIAFSWAVFTFYREGSDPESWNAKVSKYTGDIFTDVGNEFSAKAPSPEAALASAFKSAGVNATVEPESF